MSTPLTLLQMDQRYKELLQPSLAAYAADEIDETELQLRKRAARKQAQEEDSVAETEEEEELAAQFTDSLLTSALEEVVDCGRGRGG